MIILKKETLYKTKTLCYNKKVNKLIKSACG